MRRMEMRKSREWAQGWNSDSNTTTNTKHSALRAIPVMIRALTEQR